MPEHTATKPPSQQGELSSPVGTIDVGLRQVHRTIAGAIGLLMLGALWSLVLVHLLDARDTLVGEISIRLFFLDGEQGFPAAFSAGLMLCAAGATLLAARSHPGGSPMSRHAGRWRLLALLLAALAFDEAFVIHETFGSIFGRLFGVSGMLWHAWVLPYGILALTVAALMIAPLRALPSRTRMLMLAGGACFVIGAAGMELVTAGLSIAEASRLARDASIFAEELLEMLGTWLFLTGALTLLRGTAWRVDVR